MATNIYTTNLTNGLDLGTSNNAIVMDAVRITNANANGTGVIANGSNQRVIVYGSVAADHSAVFMGSSVTANNTVIIGESAVLAANLFQGLGMVGSGNTVINHGSIFGTTSGVSIFGPGLGNVFQNYGTISSSGVGVLVDTTSSGNGGVFTNYGTIVGLDESFKSNFASQNDTFVNFGTMQGDVVLGGGSDTFSNRGAGVVNGTIFGGAGVDTFILGAGAETINGGEGTDYIDFRQANGVRFTLDDSFENTGLAAGDSFVFIEGVYGSRRADFIVGGIENNSFDGASGNDTLIGGAGLDSLFGGNGVDQINGGDGADVVLGGGGKDIITGGAGDDEFRFAFLSDGGDIITDFSNRAGNNDRITISADELAFAGILGPRALLANEFHIGRTNIAPGAEDRIIVRTTDNTVWFDSNGRVTGGLTLIADLQAGVTLTFADFFFV